MTTEVLDFGPKNPRVWVRDNSGMRLPTLWHFVTLSVKNAYEGSCILPRTGTEPKYTSFSRQTHAVVQPSPAILRRAATYRGSNPMACIASLLDRTPKIPLSNV